MKIELERERERIEMIIINMLGVLERYSAVHMRRYKYLVDSLEIFVLFRQIEFVDGV